MKQKVNQKWWKVLLAGMSSVVLLSACGDAATGTETETSKPRTEEVSSKSEGKKPKKDKEKESKESKESKASESAAAESASEAASSSVSESEAPSSESDAQVEAERAGQHTTVPSVPEGQDYLVVNGNIPFFTNADISEVDEWEEIGVLDHLGRVTTANALLGVDLMPAEERGSISSVTPTGWNQARYAGIDSGGWLYNRSHLIGHQMTGNDSWANLMTGTRHFNMNMLPFENTVAAYIERTENHVRYRITPVFEGDNLLASGIYMEGFSIEDNGSGVMFHIFVPNRQPGVILDYTDGTNQGPEGPAQAPEEGSLTLPAVTTPAPTPEPQPEPSPPAGGDVSRVDTNGNGKVTIKEAKAAGFSMPIYSDHWLYPYMDDRDGDGMVGE